MSRAEPWSREEWDRVHELFNQWRECSSADRVAGLASEAREDLRAAVLELLEQHDRTWASPSEDRDGPHESASLRVPNGYQLVGEPKHGGMGIVVEAMQLQPRRRVALKFLGSHLSSEAQRWRFEREIELLARLRHPGIARLYEAGVTTDDEPWFAMEFVPGAQDLFAHANELALDARERLRLVIRVCEAVHHAHLRGVVHRDLKPSNVLVDEDGRPVVIDFGVGRRLDDGLDTEADAHTRAGELLGTVRYMSPEQLAGADVDLTSDVFALGVVLFEFLTGAWPFEASSTRALDMAEALRTAPPRRLSSLRPGLGRDLDTVLAKALEKEPNRRYESARALADDLQRFLEHRPISARPASLAYSARSYVRRYRWFAIAGTLVLASLIAGLAMAIHGLQRARDSEAMAHEATLDALGAQRDAEAAAQVAQLERTRAMTERDRAQTVLDFFCRGLSASNPRNLGRAVTVVEFVEQVSQQAVRSFDTHPLVAARLLEATGRVTLSMGAIERGAQDLRRCLELRRGHLESGHPDIVKTMGFLADAELLRGDFDAALSLAEQALDEYRRHAPSTMERDAILSDLLSSFGMAAVQSGAVSKALPALREALERKRAETGEDSETTLSVKAALGLALTKDGDFDAARELFLDVFEVQFERHPEGHPDLVMASSLLSELERSAGNIDAAIESARESLAMAERCFGPQHPDLAHALHGLGLALVAGEQCEEAEESLLRSIRVYSAALGSDYPQRATSEAALASAYECLGDDPESARLRARDESR